ncbi:glycosyltransferase [Brachybacterium sp. DNPG3]
MTAGTHRARIAIATNNGDIGGGEVMLLNIAEALRELGIEVLVIGPARPGDLVAEAAERGFETIVLPAQGRRAYMLALLRWRLRNRRIPLWCNGLVPSTATAGIGPRIVHLHILPSGLQKAAVRVARLGARATLVPSSFMAERIPGARVLANWTVDIARREPAPEGHAAHRVGYLGRLTRDKGVDVLARAMTQVIAGGAGDERLLLAGENRFGTEEDDRAISGALAPIADHVDQPGWIDRGEFFAAVDLAVFPSIWPESFGMTVAEAMAAGAPFVITDVGALPEVAGGDHPWIVPAGDDTALAAAITAALADADPSGRSAQADAARMRWEQEFSPAAGRRRVAELLAQLPDLARRPAGGARPIDPTHPQEASR